MLRWSSLHHQSEQGDLPAVLSSTSTKQVGLVMGASVSSIWYVRSICVSAPASRSWPVSILLQKPVYATRDNCKRGQVTCCRLYPPEAPSRGRHIFSEPHVKGLSPGESIALDWPTQMVKILCRLASWLVWDTSEVQFLQPYSQTNKWFSLYARWVSWK